MLTNRGTLGGTGLIAALAGITFTLQFLSGCSSDDSGGGKAAASDGGSGGSGNVDAGGSGGGNAGGAVTTGGRAGAGGASTGSVAMDDVLSSCLWATACLNTEDSYAGAAPNTSVGSCIAAYESQVRYGLEDPWGDLATCASASPGSCDDFRACLLATNALCPPVAGSGGLPDWRNGDLCADGTRTCDGSCAPPACTGTETTCASAQVADACNGSSVVRKLCQRPGREDTGCTTSGGLTACVLGQVGTCTGPSSAGCEGNVFVACQAGVERRLNCADLGQTCSETEGCTKASDCTYDTPGDSCSGNVLTTCVAGRPHTVDCAAFGGTCGRVRGASAGCVIPDTGSSGAGGATGAGGAGAGGAGAGGAAAGGAPGAGGAGAGGLSGTGGANGTGGVSGGTESCDTRACQDCFQASQGGLCAAVDNPCNDDPSCNPQEDSWRSCICLANGDTAATAACDSAFSGAHSVAPSVISCARANCEACYAAGTGTECKITQASCQACMVNECGAQRTACGTNQTCASAMGSAGNCLCPAQLGQGGTVAACIDALRISGGQAASDLIDCMTASCVASCGL